jgi:hypothetical protein
MIMSWWLNEELCLKLRIYVTRVIYSVYSQTESVLAASRQNYNQVICPPTPLHPKRNKKLRANWTRWSTKTHETKHCVHRSAY